MKVLFLGTSEFACPSLEALLASPREVLGVITQPDRPKGRGQRLAPSPVKSTARKKGVPVFQPEKLRAPSSLELLKSLAPDLVIVAAYGQILSPEVLSVPPLGCLNVHASLLPRYRGAAPIAWTILNGDTHTGVTTMLMDAGMDTGPLLLARQTPISSADTAGTLHDRLSLLGAQLLMETLEDLDKGLLTPRPQDSSQATYAPKINKEEGRLRWDFPAQELGRRLRAFDPWPGAFTTWQGRTLKLFCPEVIEKLPSEPPGTLAEVSGGFLRIAAARSYLLVGEIQLENRPRMTVAEFLKGHALQPGIRLGS